MSSDYSIFDIEDTQEFQDLSPQQQQEFTDFHVEQNGNDIAVSRFDEIQQSQEYQALEFNQKQQFDDYYQRRYSISAPVYESDSALKQSFTSLGSATSFSKNMLIFDYDAAAQSIADITEYQQRNPDTEAGKGLATAWEGGEGVADAIGDVVDEVLNDVKDAPTIWGKITSLWENASAMGSDIVKQSANMIPAMGGMMAGAAAGSAIAGPVGTVLGVFTGASSGSAVVEGQGIAIDALHKAGINPKDTKAVSAFLKENQKDLFGKTAIKSGILGGFDTMTAGIGHFLLSGPGKLATKKALSSMGTDMASKTAVKTAMNSAEFGEKILKDASFQATQKGLNKAARNTVAAVGDPIGEMGGEYVGSGVALDDWDTKNAVLEGLSSIGTSTGMFAGQKVIQAATKPKQKTVDEVSQEVADIDISNPEAAAESISNIESYEPAQDDVLQNIDAVSLELIDKAVDKFAEFDFPTVGSPDTKLKTTINKEDYRHLQRDARIVDKTPPPAATRDSDENVDPTTFEDAKAGATTKAVIESQAQLKERRSEHVKKLKDYIAKNKQRAQDVRNGVIDPAELTGEELEMFYEEKAIRDAETRLQAEEAKPERLQGLTETVVEEDQSGAMPTHKESAQMRKDAQTEAAESNPYKEDMTNMKARGGIKYASAIANGFDKETIKEINRTHPGLISHKGKNSLDEVAVDNNNYDGTDDLVEKWKETKTIKKLEADILKRKDQEWYDAQAAKEADQEKLDGAGNYTSKAYQELRNDFIKDPEVLSDEDIEGSQNFTMDQRIELLDIRADHVAAEGKKEKTGEAEKKLVKGMGKEDEKGDLQGVVDDVRDDDKVQPSKKKRVETVVSKPEVAIGVIGEGTQKADEGKATVKPVVVTAKEEKSYSEQVGDISYGDIDALTADDQTTPERKPDEKSVEKSNKNAVVTKVVGKSTIHRTSAFNEEITSVASEWMEQAGMEVETLFLDNDDVKFLSENLTKAGKPNVSALRRIPILRKDLAMQRMAVAIAKDYRKAGKINGAVSTFGNGKSVIAVGGDTSVATPQNLEMIGHEIGHNLKMSRFAAAPKSTQDAIVAEWKKGVAGTTGRMASGDFTVRDMLLDRYPPVLADNSINVLAKDAEGKLAVTSLSKKDLRYLLNFEEWFANETARFFSTDEKATTTVDKFFKDVADAIKAFYKKVTGNDNLPTEVMVDFIKNKKIKIVQEVRKIGATKTGDYESNKKGLGDILKSHVARFDNVDHSKYVQMVPILNEMMEQTDGMGHDLQWLVNDIVGQYGSEIKPYIRQWLKEKKDAISGSADLEQGGENRKGAAPEMEASVQDQGRGRGDGSTGRTDEETDIRRGRPDGGAGVPGRSTTTARKTRDTGNKKRKPRADKRDPRSTDTGRSIVNDDPRPQADRETSKSPENAATEVSGDGRVAQQNKANSSPSKMAGPGAIKDDLPILFKDQQEDVLFMEDRLLATEKPERGVMLTNGTGTGKTYSGLGQIKRFVNQGKKNVLIIVPGSEVARAWVDSGEVFDLGITNLENTKDAGQGVVVTSYANFRANKSLVKRNFDLIVMDESHKLLEGQKGEATSSLEKFWAMTGHDRGHFAYTKSINTDLYQKIDDLNSEIKGMEKSDDRRQWEAIPGKQDELKDLYAKAQELRKEDATNRKEHWEKQNTKVVFLSATPFAYEKSLDYAEGFLFHFGDRQGTGYNATDARANFYVTNLGYRMRYNKLTQPEADVDSGLMQRELNERLKEEGAIRGRRLDVPFDYSREFISTEELIGSKIDEVFQYLRDKSSDLHENFPDKSKAFSDMSKVFQDRFKYHTMISTVEALKARSAVKRIDQHIALGRKVVLFHDRIKGGGVDIFANTFTDKELLEAYYTMADERPDLVNIDLTGLEDPITMLSREYGDKITFYNGTISKKEKSANPKDFNDDNGKAQIIMVQSEGGKEGISLHDTTGKHPRVMMNLGLPVKPTQAMQIEGRTYRVGQASDAIFEYFNTGTSFERRAFGTSISERAGTAENLALGNEARTIKEAFIDGYEAAHTNEPHDDQGKGGKESDAPENNVTSDFDKAISHYFANQKKTARTKAAEGVDYFATPEPLGLKMVEWADIKPGDKVLEPSAGHGAIGRYFPATSGNTFIEPSTELSATLALRAKGKILQERFEDHDIHNKYDAIIMNPPFGKGGATAVKHLAKAAKHLRNGGRIVAILPDGPAANRKFDKWYQEESGDMHLVTQMSLPSSTFGRAGTKVRANIVVLEKNQNSLTSAYSDFSKEDNIKDFFKRIESKEVPERTEVIDEPSDTLEKYNLKVEKIDNPAKPWAVTGKTWPHKNLIKNLVPPSGRMWSGPNKAWLFTEDPTILLVEALESKGVKQHKQEIGGQYAHDTNTVPKAPVYEIDKTDEKRLSLERAGLYDAATRTGVRDFTGNIQRYSFPDVDTLPVQEMHERFRDFFGDSLAVNEKGEPLVFFHGSKGLLQGTDESSFFDDARLGTYGRSPKSGFGHTFTANPRQASMFDGDVNAFYLRVENPYIISNEEAEKYSAKNSTQSKARQFFFDLKEKGHDSIWYEGGEFLYVFDGHQAKLFDNPGTWAKDDIDLRRSVESFGEDTFPGKYKKGDISAAAKDLVYSDDREEIIQKLEGIFGPRDESEPLGGDGSVMADIALDYEADLERAANDRDVDEVYDILKQVAAEEYEITQPEQQEAKPWEQARTDKQKQQQMFEGAENRQKAQQLNLFGGKKTKASKKRQTLAKKRKLAQAATKQQDMFATPEAEQKGQMSMFGDVEVKRSVAGFSPFTGTKDSIDRIIQSSSPKWQDRMERFIYHALDKDDPRKRIYQTGTKKTARNDILTVERLRGKKTADEVDTFMREKVEPLLKHLAKKDIKQSELEEYAYSLHVPERNLQMQRVNAKRYVDRLIRQMTDKESGFWKDQVEEIKADAELNEWDLSEKHDAYLELMESMFFDHESRQAGINERQAELDNTQWTAAQEEKGTPEFHQNRLDKSQERLDRSVEVQEEWAERSPRFAGITDEEAQSITERYESDSRIDDIKEATTQLAAINQGRLRLLRQSGELTKKEYDSINTLYENYVPLYRDGFDDDRPATGRVLGPLGKPLKVAKGSMREVVNILAHTVQNYQTAINRKHKSFAGKTLYNFVEQNPDSGITIESAPAKPTHDKEGNLVMYPDPQEPDNGVFVKIDGKRYTLIFDTDKRTQRGKTLSRFLESIKGSDAQLGPIMRGLTQINRFLAGLNTMWSPEFILSNFSRDIQTAGIHLEDTAAKGMQVKILKDVFPAIKGIYQAERGNDKTKMGELYRDFSKNGGKIGWMQGYDEIGDLASELELTLQLHQPGHKVKKSVKFIKDLVSSSNTAVENGVRLAVYKNLIETGKATKAEAALAASNLTVDFTRRGTAGPSLNALYMFANAGIQGNVRMIKGFKNSKKIRKITGGIVGAGFALHFLAMAMGGDDETGEPYINSVEDFVKERNIIIMIPDSGGKYIKIPMPYVYNAIFNGGSEIARMFSDLMNDRDYSVSDGTFRVLLSFMNSFNPIQSGTVLQTLAPTLMDPVVQAYEEKTYSGGSLMPGKNPFNPNKPDNQRYWDSVSAPSKQITKTLNKLTGGDEFEGGVIDMSPETLDMMYDTATGSVGRFVKNTLALPFRAASEEGVELGQIPLVRRFAGGQSKYVISKRYREVRKDISIFDDRFDAAETVQERRVLAKQPEYKQSKLFKQTNKIVSKLQKQIKKYEANGKEDIVKKINARIQEYQVDFLKKVQKIK